MSAKYDFTLKQGSTFNLDGQYIQGSDGLPRDLSGYSIASQLRPTYDSAVSHSFTAAFVDETDGTFRLEMTAAQTSAITASDYKWDCEISSGSYVERILEGIVTCSPEVTK